MNTFGEVSWNDDINFGKENDKKSGNNKDIWLKLDEGSNVVRLLTQPHQYVVHKGIKKVGEKGFGRKVSCTLSNGKCVLCEKGFKPTPRWYLGVLDRRSGTYKVLDISYQVFSHIRKLARKVDVWGDPTKYDIDIVVDKNGGPTNYYSVQPIPHKPLTPQEQAIRDAAPIEDLKRKIEPLTVEQAQKYLDKILAGGELALPVVKEGDKASKGAKTAAPTADMSDDDAIDEIFPDYDSK